MVSFRKIVQIFITKLFCVTFIMDLVFLNMTTVLNSAVERRDTMPIVIIT